MLESPIHAKIARISRNCHIADAVESDIRSAALWRHKALVHVRYGHGRQVGQLARIEERPPAGVALFEPDTRLLGIDQSIHRAGTAWTSVVFDLVMFFAGLYVADIERGGRLLAAELFKLAVVEPQAMACLLYTSDAADE